jgi:hypothetical protein
LLYTNTRTSSEHAKEQTERERAKKKTRKNKKKGGGGDLKRWLVIFQLIISLMLSAFPPQLRAT